MVRACLGPTGRIAPAALGCIMMLAASSCKPEFDERSSEVSSPRILAVQSEPAEAWPGATIQYRALSVDKAGPRPDLSVQWAYCTLPRPASELNDTTITCFEESGPNIVPLAASGVATSGTLPQSACNQFGPDLPQVQPGEPVRRPADPDATGGYYQPLRLLFPIGGQYLFTLAETRILCNLPGATGEVLRAYTKEYRANTNPALASVVAATQRAPGGVALTSAEASPSEEVAPLVVAPGETVRLTATWADCPVSASCGDGVCSWDEAVEACPSDCTTPIGCSGAEAYVSFDLGSRTLTNRRESLRLSWYSNAGEFRDDRTGRAEEEANVASTENEWTAPVAPGLVHWWLVLRDSRGGTSWATFRVSVEG